MTFSEVLFLIPLLILWMSLIAITTADMIKFTFIAVKERDYNFLAQAFLLTIIPLLLVFLLDT